MQGEVEPFTAPAHKFIAWMYRMDVAETVYQNPTQTASIELTADPISST